MKISKLNFAFLIAVIGAASQLSAFLYYFSWSKQGDPITDFPLVVWQIVPFVTTGLLIFCWSRFSAVRTFPQLLTAAGFLQLLSLPVLLPRAFETPVELPGGGFSFEPNLVFLFAPFYQIVVVLLFFVLSLAMVPILKWRENRNKAT